MLRIVNKSFQVAARGRTAFPVVARSFSGKFGIPTDQEQQTGRRRQEVDAEAVGEVAFNRDPIVPPVDAGTKESPILVPSGNHSRVVGYEDPFTHQLLWFSLDAGALHYIPEIGLYFKLDVQH